ncbi:hypothetical protein D3C78_1337680 [compost metagenome]
MLQHLQRRARVGMQRLTGRRVAGDPGQVELDRSQRAADVVMDFARNRRPFLFNRRLQVLGQLGQAPLGQRELGHGLLLGAAGFMHFHGPGQHQRQARHVFLAQEIRHSQPHDIHGCRFANGARQQDERRARSQRLDQRPGIEGRESGQVVIGQDQVEFLVGQCLLQIVQRLHGLDAAGQASAAQGDARKTLVGG